MVTMNNKKNTHIANPTTVAPSPIAATPSKPIMTTAPSQSNSAAVSAAATGSAVASTLPPLKQKTGIVKSKVPPPVPPRGSPKDRRGHHHHQTNSNRAGSSPKGTPPSSGSYNYLNDKYFACTQSTTSRRPSQTQSINNFDKHRFTILTNEEPVPIFGDRRSPSCVQDWLEINDFNISAPDQSPKRVIATASSVDVIVKKPIAITTQFLQRENSLRNSASSSVRSIVKNFSNDYKNTSIARNSNLMSTGNNKRMDFSNKIFPAKDIGKSDDISNNFIQNNEISPRNSIRKSLDNLSINKCDPPRKFESEEVLGRIPVQNFNALKHNFERKSVYLSNTNIHNDEIATLKKLSNVSKLVSTYSNNAEQKMDVTNGKPKITSIIKKESSPELTSIIKKESSPLPVGTQVPKSVLKSLKPARRKKRQAPRAEDIYCNAKEKQHIISTLSNVEIRSSDENYDTVIDSFSLEGEFV